MAQRYRADDRVARSANHTVNVGEMHRRRSIAVPFDVIYPFIKYNIYLYCLL